jgi:hypothetical protein
MRFLFPRPVALAAGASTASGGWATAAARRLSSSRVARAVFLASAILVCASFASPLMAPARLPVGTRQVLREHSRAVALLRGKFASAPAARADLDAVLSGSWAAVDLAPVNALASALDRYLNVSLTESHTVA